MVELPIGEVKVDGKAEGIGRISWFSVRSFELDRETLLKKWTEAGLPESEFLNAPRAPDCFKVATRIIDQRIRVDDATNTVTKYMVRYEEGRPAVRHVVRERYKKGDEKPFAFDDVGVLTYDVDGTVSGKKYDTNDEEWDSIVGDVKTRYETLMKVHNDVDVRTALQRKLKKWHSLLLRPTGGVYFVPKDFAGEVDRYADFLRSIGSEMWALVVSKADSGMVKKKFEDHKAEVSADIEKKKEEATKTEDPKVKKSIEDFIREENARLAEMSNYYNPLE
ncbi:Uncharacterised protein [uncultured archaeon]|nr:Uncharacterised protein [uncultured archaeon]